MSSHLRLRFAQLGDSYLLANLELVEKTNERTESPSRSRTVSTGGTRVFVSRCSRIRFVFSPACPLLTSMSTWKSDELGVNTVREVRTRPCWSISLPMRICPISAPLDFLKALEGYRSAVDELFVLPNSLFCLGWLSCVLRAKGFCSSVCCENDLQGRVECSICAIFRLHRSGQTLPCLSRLVVTLAILGRCRYHF